MKRNKTIIYILAVIATFSIVIIPLFCPCSKDYDFLMLLMQGLNILVFLHISYKLSTEEQQKYIYQQKIDNERQNKQLKFDLVKEYVNEFDKYREDIQKINEFTNISQFYIQEIPKFDTLMNQFDKQNLRLMNILDFYEYDIYIFIQSNIKTEYYKFRILVQKLDENRKYSKSDTEILEIDDFYINTLSHLSMISDYLYFILLHNGTDYDTDKKLEIVKNAFENLKLKNLDKKSV